MPHWPTPPPPPLIGMQRPRRITDHRSVAAPPSAGEHSDHYSENLLLGGKRRFHMPVS